jgi:BirA family biotin operon repressor/biotin-[acetyl-CoA-carboxylase] ligase
VTLGRPHLHFRTIGSTNERARELAVAGAPHGTLVTADAQTAGRGRQGRTWVAPPGQALLLSMVVRDPPPLLSLRAGLAVAALAGEVARVKWPNDVLVDGRKVAGVLVEGRPVERWAVVGIGVNAAVDVATMPVELRERAGSLGLAPSRLPAALDSLLGFLSGWLMASDEAVLSALRSRDALLGRTVRWSGGLGKGAGIAADGSLLVDLGGGAEISLDAGEVHLVPSGA